MTPNSDTPDFTAVKAKQQKTWATGDFSMVAITINLVSELLCEALDLRPDERVLDVATGSGNTAIAAARRWCDVTGVDYVPELLERGRERANAERVDVTFADGDAEALPFPDASFDVVTSTFGVMFAPHQEKTAAELLRVCRPGGKIGLANWTPEGFIGQLFKLTGGYVPPPAGLRPPPQWGTEERLRELFGDQITSLTTTARDFTFRFRSFDHWISFFRTFYGPTAKAFEALGEERQADYVHDLAVLVEKLNRSGGDAMIVPATYLEVVAIRR